MCKSEIFAEILNIVGKETEVSTELIHHHQIRCCSFLA